MPTCCMRFRVSSVALPRTSEAQSRRSVGDIRDWNPPRPHAARVDNAASASGSVQALVWSSRSSIRGDALAAY